MIKACGIISQLYFTTPDIILCQVDGEEVFIAVVGWLIQN